MNTLTEWYNENENRAYPISEQATRLATSGSRLPDAAIVDLCIMAPPALTDFYLSSLRITPAYVSVGISTPTTGALTTTVARTDLLAYTAYPLTSIIDNVTGWIVFGTYTPSGVEDYRFSSSDASKFEPRVIRPIDALPVTSLTRGYGSAVTKLITVRGGSNVVVDGQGANIVVRLNPDFAAVAAGPCQNGASRRSCKLPPLRSINGVCPDEDGILTVRFE